MKAPALAVTLVGAVAAFAARPVPSITFRDAAAESGLVFEHVNGGAGRYHLPEIMGAGAALVDYDVDGDLDALLIQGQVLDGQPDGSIGAHRLFRNELDARERSLRFTDVTARAGLASGDYGMGVATGDYDNDGDPDLYITNFGANRLYRNNGDGTFSDVTRAAGAGLDDPRWSSSATFTDFDADGDLDLFVANYVDFTVAGSKGCHDPTGMRDYCGPRQFRPVPDRLFRNNGDRTFTDISEASGITQASGRGLGVVAADFNGDRRIDFYVANDGTVNHLWINRGDGTFEDAALLAGVAVSGDGHPEASMGIAAGDADNDGDVDLFITNITMEGHAYYVNLGRGDFEDRRLPSGLGLVTLPYTGFGTDWADFDNDSRLDLFTANGAVTILEAVRGGASPFAQRNQVLRNIGGGRLLDVTSDAGPSLRLVEVSRGAAFGDVDNDGDMDVLQTNNAGPVRLLLNMAPRGNASLQVQLIGVKDNRQGLGARVGVQRADGIVLWRRARTDGSYLSASDPRVHVGLGAAARVTAIVVEWPTGLRESWPVSSPSGVVALRQGTGTALR